MRSNNRANSTPDPALKEALASALVEARKNVPGSPRFRLFTFLFRWNWILLSICFTVFIVLGLFGLLFPGTTINLLLMVMLGLTVILFLIGRDLRIPMHRYQLKQAFKQPILQLLVDHFFDQADYYPDKGIKKKNLEWLDLLGKDIDRIYSEDLIDGQWKGHVFWSSEVFLYKDIFPPLRWADKSAAYLQGIAFLIAARQDNIPNFHCSPIGFPVSKLLDQQMVTSSMEQDYLMYFEERWFSREMNLVHGLRQFNTENNTQLLIGKSEKGFYAFLPSRKDNFELNMAVKTPKKKQEIPKDLLDSLLLHELPDHEGLKDLIQELLLSRKVLDFLLHLPEMV